MSIDVAPINKNSLSKQVADQLQQAIFSGTLKANDRLPTETELAQRFNVSRPTIREALKRLAAKNLVRSKRGPAGGTFVNQLDSKELGDQLITASTLFVSMNNVSLSEIRESRLALESLCLKAACKMRTEKDIEQLEQELQVQMQPDISAEDFCASDVRFHRLIANASHNKMLSFVMFTLIESLQPVANMIAYRYQKRDIITQQHTDMLSAIHKQNAAEACKVLEQQLNYLGELHTSAENRHR